MKKVSKPINFKLLSLVAAIGMFFAAFSSGHCWIVLAHQRKCPAHLIKED